MVASTTGGPSTVRLCFRVFRVLWPRFECFLLLVCASLLFTLICVQRGLTRPINGLGSLVEPASLPVTTDFLPSEGELCALSSFRITFCSSLPFPVYCSACVCVCVCLLCAATASDYNYYVDYGNFASAQSVRWSWCISGCVRYEDGTHTPDTHAHTYTDILAHTYICPSASILLLRRFHDLFRLSLAECSI